MPAKTKQAAAEPQIETPTRTGWPISAWCESISIAKATLYTLPPELQPASVKIGKRRIITEQPAAYLERIAKVGGPAA